VAAGHLYLQIIVANTHFLLQRVGWFVALATDRQEHSYGGGGLHSRVQHWMQSYWHMHVSKTASAVAIGVPLGNVMGLHCLLQSQATVTLHTDKRAKDSDDSSNNSSNSERVSSSSAPSLNGGTAAGDMYALKIIEMAIAIAIRTNFIMTYPRHTCACTHHQCPG
jgi:hypothetical protein